MKKDLEVELLKAVNKSLENQIDSLEDIIKTLEKMNQIQAEHIKELEIKLKGD